VSGGQIAERNVQKAPVAVAYAEVGNDDASSHHLVHDAQGCEGLQSPSMDDSRARVGGWTRGPIQDGDPHSVPGEHGSRREPDRARPDHGDLYLIGYRSDRRSYQMRVFVPVHTLILSAFGWSRKTPTKVQEAALGRPSSASNVLLPRYEQALVRMSRPISGSFHQEHA